MEVIIGEQAQRKSQLKSVCRGAVVSEEAELLCRTSGSEDMLMLYGGEGERERDVWSLTRGSRLSCLTEWQALGYLLCRPGA